VINTLETAKACNVDSVSIPAISSGVLGFPKDECAKIMIRIVSQWFGLQSLLADDIEKKEKITSQKALSRVTKLRKVRLCNFDDITV
jgi:O-acetyl-ADP-ribose deacetylase (regulator of RNase III)